MPNTNTRRVKEIVARARKYGRSLRRLRATFNADAGDFEYEVWVAKARSGQRGGEIRGSHGYVLINLTPEERAMLRQGIRQEPGCEEEISQA
jgi:hypothetical protein